MRLHPRLVLFVPVALLACGSDQAPASQPAAPAPASAPPAPSSAARPAEVTLAAHGVTIRVPDGWSVTGDQDASLVMAPDRSAGYLLYGVMDVGEGGAMLRRADEAFGVRMPVIVGKLTAFPSGIRFMVATEQATRSDGTALTVAVLLGPAPAHPDKGGIGILAFWHRDLDPERLELVQDAINSVAPVR